MWILKLLLCLFLVFLILTLVVCCFFSVEPGLVKRGQYRDRRKSFYFDCPVLGKKIGLYVDNPVINNRKEEQQGVIFFIHGLGEHSGLYLRTRDYFLQRNFRFVSFDLRGHGKSDGARCYVSNFEEYVTDVSYVFRRFVSSEEENIFFMGHSLGSLILLYIETSSGLRNFFVDYDIKGLITLGTTSDVTSNASFTMITLFKLIGTLFPSLYCTAGDNIHAYTTMKSEIDFFKSDRLLSRDWRKFGLAKQLVAMAELVEGSLEKIQIPVIFNHGFLDAVVPKSNSEKPYEMASSKDKDIYIYENCRHNLLHDRARKDLLERLEEWMEERCT